MICKGLVPSFGMMNIWNDGVKATKALFTNYANFALVDNV